MRRLYLRARLAFLEYALHSLDVEKQQRLAQNIANTRTMQQWDEQAALDRAEIAAITAELWPIEQGATQ